jgi:hypothetical protein
MLISEGSISSGGLRKSVMDTMLDWDLKVVTGRNSLRLLLGLLGLGISLVKQPFRYVIRSGYQPMVDKNAGVLRRTVVYTYLP